MSGLARRLTAAAVALSLCSVSTVAISAVPPPPTAAPSAATTAIPANPWLTLSAMTTSSSVASSAAAAQYYDGRPGFPPWPALAVILATISLAIYILVKDDDGNLDIPISPD
jgi:hypothetical protein